MPRYLQILTILLLATLSVTLYTLHRAIQKHPEVIIHWTFSKEDIDNARHILNQNPNATENPLQTLELNTKELNLVANYLLNRYAKSATMIGLHTDSLSILTTLDLPETFFGRYLNIRLILTFDADRRHPILSELKFGKLHVAPKLAALLIDGLISYSSLQRYYILASRYITDIELYATKIVIFYHPNAATLKQARNLLNIDTKTEALRAYRQKLAETLDKHDPAWRLSLAEVLQPLFVLAAQRSTPDTAIEENRALLYTAAAYVNNQQLPTLLDDKDNLAPLRRYPVFVYKRIDMAQHFIASAALSAAGNGYFADKLGVEKELHDAKNGSGFSFIDLAADRAGLRFGEIAVSNADNARKLQQEMARHNDYSAFVPDVSDLPENLDEATFKSRFGSLDSAATQALIAQIDARLDSCAVIAAFK